MTLSHLDLGVIIGYLILTRWIGATQTRTRDSGGSLARYLLAERALPGWALGLSLVGTSISSVTFLAFPGEAFKGTWLRFIPCLALPLALWIMSALLLPRMVRDQHTTAYELLEERFSLTTRRYAAFAFLSAQLTRVSVVLYLLALITQSVTGLNAELCVVITGGLVALYTTGGGLVSVVWTDVVQVLTLSVGGLLCLGTIATLTPGGMSALWDAIAHSDQLSFGVMSEERRALAPEWSFTLIRPNALMLFFIGLMSWLTEYVSNQGVSQRLYAARSERDARVALKISAALSVPLWALFMTIGTALSTFFVRRPDLIPRQIISGEVAAEYILPYFIVHYMPAGFAGLALAAALAAAMSSLDSSLNAVASVFTYDFTPRHYATLTPSARERALLKRARGVTLGAAGLMIVGALALLNVNTETLQDTLLTLGALLSGGLLSLYLIALFSQRPRASHVAYGIGAALLCTLWPLGARAGLIGCPFDVYYTGLISNVALWGVTWGATWGAIGHDRLRARWRAQRDT